MNYAATDPLGRWVGLGRPLHALEIDYNFYNLDTRVTTLEASITTTVSISSVTQPTSTQMQINLSNSASYTLTLPTATLVDRSAWLPATAYFVNDTFTANGSLYRVVFDHTSASSFSPTANDGAGHDFYATMMSSPGNALPTGGAAGMFLKKSSSTDYAVSWSYVLPNGGTANQVLAKSSSTDQAVAWITLGATMVSFSPSTASGLTSNNVAGALEEVEASIDAKIATALGTFGGSLDALSDVQFATGDPQFGALLFFGGTKWAGTAEPNTGDFLKFDGSAWAPVAPTFAMMTDNLSVSQRVDTTLTNLGSSVSGGVTVDLSVGMVYSLDPNGNITLNAASTGYTCQEITILIYQFTTTAITVTFGTNFRTTGTLALGTTNNKVFVVKFVNNGGTWLEVSRTTAM